MYHVGCANQHRVCAHGCGPWAISKRRTMDFLHNAANEEGCKSNPFEASWSSGDLGGLSLSHFNLRGQ